ncbi:MAG: hypothetical protein QUS14_04425 [Pyrinomonadaceae bacterium]|nr:hypothetical protein [Pyrinomonadaceae bacterium]
MRTRFTIFVVFALAAAFGLPVAAQSFVPVTYNGSVLQFGSGLNTRNTTNTFQLNIRGVTPETEINRLLAVLAEGGQDDLLKEIEDRDLGNISIGGRLGPRINAVSISEVDGKKRVIAVFARWLQFAELRGGYRSTDYPFGYVEMFVDPKTGKAEGTYIGAAKIRWRRTDAAPGYEVEVESFATFPGKLMGVKERKR